MPATKYPDTQIIERNRQYKTQIAIYLANGTATHTLGATDVVQCKIWDGVDSSAAHVTVTSSGATANGSTLVIDDLDPATCTLTIDASDTALIPQGPQRMELACVVSGEATVVARCPVICEGSPT
jgi:hypothetical protein